MSEKSKVVDWEKKGKELVKEMRASRDVAKLERLADELINVFENTDSRFKEARTAAYEIMDKSTMPYHNSEHAHRTERAALILAVKEGVEWEVLKLVCLSGAFHETGVLGGFADHEHRSMLTAYREMEKAGYTDQESSLSGNIIAHGTRMPQMPRDLLEMIMADADLVALGTWDFFATKDLLRKECGVENELEWNGTEIKFVENHTWHTKAAKELFGKQQDKNLMWLRSERNVLLGIA